MIEFSYEEREAIAARLQAWCRDELSVDIGLFDAGFLLDFFTREVAPAYYNKALEDARTLMETKLESLTDSFYELEVDVTVR